jgi:hypothetical protein
LVAARNDLSKMAQERLARARMDYRYSLGRILARGGCVAFGLYVFMQGLAPFAGQNTGVLVNMAFSILGNFTMVASVSMTGSAVIWALVERHLRYRKTEKLQGRIKELELTIDPRRSSSNLLPSGKTNPLHRDRS